MKLKIVEAKSLVNKNDKETIKRISGEHVGYMEISQKSNGFSCGDCKGLNEEGFCENPEVKAYVSKDYGCCNYFNPKNAQITFPKNKEKKHEDN